MNSLKRWKKRPLMIVNFKAYEKGVGDRAVELALMCEKVAKKYEVNIGLAVQPADIARIAKKVRKCCVISQHIDPIEFGAYTGHVHAKSVKDAGAIGTLINHSEKRLKEGEVKECVRIARRFGLISIVCCGNLREVRKYLRFKPDVIAYEPPELIGTGISVSKAKPEVVKKAAELVKDETILICGAGISSRKDVKKALELGTRGVLVASAILLAKNRKRVLESFAKEMGKWK